MSNPLHPTKIAPRQPATGEALVQHFERSPVGLILFGPDRSIVAANPATLELTGLSSAILHGAKLHRFLAAEAPERLEARIFDEVDETGRWMEQMDVRTSIADASPVMMSITLVGRAEHPDAVRYVGTIIELGQQRWIENESSRRAAELAALSALTVATGSSHDPAAMLRAAAQVIVEGLEVDACWIHRYEESGRKELALAGASSYLHPTLHLSPRMKPDAVNPGVLRAIETREQVITSELLDRSIATLVHAPLLAAGDVVGVVSILSVEGEKLATHNSELLRAVSYQLGTAIQNIRLLEAITEHQAQLEAKNEELEHLVEELRVADRLKSEFLATTSHELRTPLNSIIGFMSLVLDGVCKNEAEQQELLEHALRSAKHLLELINNVLDLARIEAGRVPFDIRDVPLQRLLREVGDTLEVQARDKDLEFWISPGPADIQVRVDEVRLRQVLMNVVGNALKFTSRGHVAIAVDTPVGAPFVAITVEDTGVGIDPERRERLFKKFSQADASTTRRFGGSGLGLVIVRELLEGMGGAIRIESEGEGKGMTATITVPRSGVTDEDSPSATAG